MDIDGEKALLRKEIREKLRVLGEKAREEDGAIVKRLLESAEFQRAGSVFCFAGVDYEINTLPIIEAALAAGKTLAVPLCLRSAVMEARVIAETRCLRKGRFGLLEPPEDTERLDASEIGLAVVPALACDRRFFRLGQGGGYYDRFLPAVKGVKAALCRSLFFFDALPAGPHDIPMDAVITGTGTLLSSLICKVEDEAGLYGRKQPC